MTDVRTIIARAIADEEFREDPVTLDYAVADRIIRALNEAGIKPLSREPTDAMIKAGVDASERLSVSIIYRALWDAAPCA